MTRDPNTTRPGGRRGRRYRGAVVLAAAAAAAAGILPPATARPAAASPDRPAPSPAALPFGTGPGAGYACDLPAAGQAACLTIANLTPAAPPPAPGSRPAGAGAGAEQRPSAYTAGDLQAAYRLPAALLGARQTIAVVVAFDNPNAEQDLAEYRKANGLPPCDANFPCLRKVDQRGGTDYPAPDVGWALESDVGLQMASAACPNCHLLLVEADDNSLANLAAAVDTAVRLGADVVSNSYGTAGEFAGQMEFAAHYDHDDAVIVASAGDLGFGVGVPAAYDGVVAVGGTSLYRDGSRRGFTEALWSGSGSGCSAYVAKPRWQRDRLCGNRTVADVAAVADPATPVLVYATFGGLPGWLDVGGTSVSTPLIAGVYALAGRTGEPDPAARLYAADRRHLFDVGATEFAGFPTANGACGGSYLCTALSGPDGPTGVGTPNGIGAF